MDEEPRPATRLEIFLIGTALIGMALLFVAWQMSVVNSETPDEHLNLSSVFAHYPPPVVTHEFRPSAPTSERSEDGLRAAALSQIVEAQKLGRDEYTDIWTRSECRTRALIVSSLLSGGGSTHASTGGSLNVHDLVVIDVVVESFQGTSGEVRVLFRDYRMETEIRNDARDAERWEYRNGAWDNATCHYSEGPSIRQMILDGTIRRAEPSPTR